MYPDIARDDIFMLETRRLWLRWPRFADAQAIVRLAGDKRISDMTARIPHPMTQADAESFVYTSRQLNVSGEGLVLAVTAKNRPNALIGTIAIRRDEADSSPHIGYWIGQPSWGQGIATEAVQMMIDTFFTYTREGDLVAAVRIDNEASQRVLLKAGMTSSGLGMMERPLHGDSVAVEHFGIKRAEWAEKLSWMQPSWINLFAKAAAA